jgi:translation initiation factor 2 beta subunit (eIF-2beta)/eIF-5
MKSDFKNLTVTNDDGDNFDDFQRNISINIVKSDVSQPVLIETFRAKGSRYDDALINARNTRYIFVQQDSVLKFNRYLQRLSPEAGWHDQSIELTLKVPMNATLVIDHEINRYINGNVDINECNETNKKSTELNSAAFIMTS